MSSYIPDDLRESVRSRAKNCCEYCLVHEDDEFLSHEIDHIISEKHRGQTESENLCLSCFSCNRHKGTDIGSLDIETRFFTRLYNPRTDNWATHFRLNEAEIIPLTAIGRVTVFLLNMNSLERIAKRRELISLNRYPCNLNEESI